jgi:serine/threonine protein kinase
VVLYEMLTGELPYTADNSIAVCMKHVTEPLRPPKTLNPAIPERMDALVARLLAKDPAYRYTSAAGLLTDLERVRDGLPPVLGVEATTQPLGNVPRAALRKETVARRRRTSRILAVASIAMLALLGTTLFGLLQEGAGGGTLPRAQGFARELIDPPAKAAIDTTKTGASTADVPGAVPPTASASAVASPTASPAASSERAPVVPAAPPPPEQVPAGSQYEGSGN